MLLIFTDLDGTLLNQEDYSYEAAIPLIEGLKTQNIPVIPVTSKTRQEVQSLLTLLKIKDPFIVENGSGIFIPQDDTRFTLPNAELWGDYRLMQLGCSYGEAKQGLVKLSQQLGAPLQGFGDLTEEDIQQLTGLSLEDVREAKAREFTEPFVTPKIPPEKIEAAVEALGFQVVVGDRFCHLIGSGAGKGGAVNWLVAQYQSFYPEAKITTLGLGNSPNDLSMLEVVDTPVVLPGNNGPHPRLATRGWKIAPSPAPQGWVEAVQAHLQGE